MPPQKRRNKAACKVDIALVIKLKEFRQQWKSLFGEEISQIEMTKIFGEFGKLDLKGVMEFRRQNHE
jgi:hypothetical protein